VHESPAGPQTLSERGGRDEQVVKQVQLAGLVTAGDGHRNVPILQRVLGQLPQLHGVAGGDGGVIRRERPCRQLGVPGHLPGVGTAGGGRVEQEPCHHDRVMRSRACCRHAHQDILCEIWAYLVLTLTHLVRRLPA
jgi:hypothetical protein